MTCKGATTSNMVAWCLQVFFCSRTHSQLSQFVSELQRTRFADTVAAVALASRKVGVRSAGFTAGQFVLPMIAVHNPSSPKCASTLGH